MIPSEKQVIAENKDKLRRTGSITKTYNNVRGIILQKGTRMWMAALNNLSPAWLSDQREV